MAELEREQESARKPQPEMQQQQPTMRTPTVNLQEAAAAASTSGVNSSKSAADAAAAPFPPGGISRWDRAKIGTSRSQRDWCPGRGGFLCVSHAVRVYVISDGSSKPVAHGLAVWSKSRRARRDRWLHFASCHRALTRTRTHASRLYT